MVFSLFNHSFHVLIIIFDIIWYVLVFLLCERRLKPLSRKRFNSFVCCLFWHSIKAKPSCPNKEKEGRGCGGGKEEEHV
jgi:hypothetical protein